MDPEIKPLAVGQQVPDFTLETFDPNGGDFGVISLEDIRRAGRWAVLVFYPADFTSVCPTELADLASYHADLEQLGGKVISISTDTKFAHMAWRRSEPLIKNVTFLMDADPNGQVSRLFGIYDAKTGLALRGSFIIDTDGRLVSAEVNYYNVGRDAGELLRKLQANAHLRENPREACPAKWVPGEETLKSGRDVLGR